MDRRAMSPMGWSKSWPTLLWAGATAGLVATAAASTGKQDHPPANRTYFVVLAGLTDPYAVEAACLSFTPTEVCRQGGACGSWSVAGAGLSFRIDLEEGVRWDGQALVENRGPRSSIGGVSYLQSSTDRINIGLAGRQVSAAQCAALVEAFEARNPAPTAEPDTAVIRTLEIHASLTAQLGSCFEATVLYDGRELAGARVACSHIAGCGRMELAAVVRSASGHHTISFQVLRQALPQVDYVVEGEVRVTRENISLGGVTLPLGPSRATLRPGESVFFGIDFTDTLN